MQLRVAPHPVAGLHGIELGPDHPGLRVGPGDLDRRPGGEVLDGDPGQPCRLLRPGPRLAALRQADLAFNIVQSIGDRVAVRLQQRPALGIGRGHGPGDREALGSREGQVHAGDAVPDGMALGILVGADLGILVRGALDLLPVCPPAAEEVRQLLR